METFFVKMVVHVYQEVQGIIVNVNVGIVGYVVKSMEPVSNVYAWACVNMHEVLISTWM